MSLYTVTRTAAATRPRAAITTAAQWSRDGGGGVEEARPTAPMSSAARRGQGAYPRPPRHGPRLLGFDHTKLTYRYNGRDFRLTDNFGNVVKDIIA
jgi:hypothetical protein